MTDVTIIPYNRDNYAYLLEAQNGTTVIIDAGDFRNIDRVLEKKNKHLDYILSTHHHFDHTDGNIPLKEKYDAKIVAPAKEKMNFKHIDIKVTEGSSLPFGNDTINVIETPAHTAGHVCYYMPKHGFLFTGDTLFSMGCGGLFEGTPAQMWKSLCKIKALPDETLIFCGHEYTIHGAKFCSRLEPENEPLKKRVREVKELRTAHKPTLPVSLAIEKATNCFLRADTPALQKALHMEGATPLSVFEKVRSGGK